MIFINKFLPLLDIVYVGSKKRLEKREVGLISG